MLVSKVLIIKQTRNMKKNVHKIVKKHKERATKVMVALFILGGLASLILPSMTSVSEVYADRLQGQLDDIEQELESNEAHADNLHREAATLKDAISQIENDAANLERQINKSRSEKKNLDKKIEETKKKIAQNQDVLADTVSDLYVDNSMTPIEMLASSNSIGDYVDKQEYRNAVRDQVAVAINTIKDLRADLEKKSDEVAEVIARQRSQEKQLVAKKKEQSELLAQTQGQERKYKQRVNELKKERESTMAAIDEAMRQAAASEDGSVGGSFNLASQGSVSAGTIIGRSGDTGFSFGCHLHLEAYEGGVRTDPARFLGRPGWVMPTSAGITQQYNNPDAMYAGGYHPGIDYGAMCGAPIVAAADGQLERGWMGAYGCAAIINHGGGVRTLYGHFSADSC